MQEKPEVAVPQNPEIPAQPAPESPVAAAVNHCMAQYKGAYRAAATMGASEYGSHKAGREAYRLALPRTGSVTEIQGFIACIAHGITLEVFDRHEPTQLLYAAQVALASLKSKTGKK